MQSQDGVRHQAWDPQHGVGLLPHPLRTHSCGSCSSQWEKAERFRGRCGPRGCRRSLQGSSHFADGEAGAWAGVPTLSLTMATRVWSLHSGQGSEAQGGLSRTHPLQPLGSVSSSPGLRLLDAPGKHLSRAECTVCRHHSSASPWVSCAYPCGLWASVSLSDTHTMPQHLLAGRVAEPPVSPLPPLC